MISIDFALLWYASFRVCLNQCGWAFKLEKASLAFMLALAFKSLCLFFLIHLGITPIAFIQISLSLVIFILTLFLPNRPSIEEIKISNKKLSWFACSLVLVLFILSMVNAWFFPITESDAIWYHIRGMSFYNEVQFNSDLVVSQLQQYPPFIPLLFVYLIAFKVGFLKVIFPLLYLSLNIVFYSRVLYLTENTKIACLFTMILATTPYFWWHGLLPFLDLTTAVFYSIGIFYWYFWLQSEIENSKLKQKNSYSLVSGIFLGLAAWTRIEFLLYDLVPVFLTILTFSRHRDKTKDLQSLGLFLSAILIFPSIWFLTLLKLEMNIWSQIKIVGVICFSLWVLTLGLVWGKWKFSELNVRLAFIVSVLGYFILLLLAKPGSAHIWKQTLISLYRTSTVHVFYLFTSFLFVFIYFEKIKNLTEIKKTLGYFLILFLFVHLAIFAYANPKWENIGQFFNATFIQPGNSINLSDTRGMMSFYPVFIFFISSLPFVRERIIND